MKKKVLNFILMCFASALFSQQKIADVWFDNTIQKITEQYALLYKEAMKNPTNFPRTAEIVDNQLVLKSTESEDWTSGFYPGSLWFIYKLTKDSAWQNKAMKWTKKLDTIQYFYGHHDVGFMIYCSYGTGYKINPNLYYEGVLVNAAKSLLKRFRPNVGTIQSWDLKGWQGTRGWQCPVIIDNMMNLKLLLGAFKITNDDTFYKVAVAHADKTLNNHFRKDFSCYHVVDYDTLTGLARDKITAQGFSDESDWARGQAWALYGFAYMYRETKLQRYLDQARHIANYLKKHPNMPKNLIPYWDLKASTINTKTTTPRDASAAAIIASALFDLSHFGTPTENKIYFNDAVKILKELSSSRYFAKLGTNANFLLEHSVGSIPHHQEIDAPLIYADYYFLEALSRYKFYKK